MKKMRLSCPVPSPLSLLLSGLLTILLLAGCMGGKQAVAPYPGRAQAEIAGTSRQAGQLVGATGPLSSGQATFSRDMLMPAVARINGRITAYEQKLQAWEEVNSRIDFSTLTPERISQFSSCRLQATDLLDDYKRLHDQLLNDQPMDVSRWLVSQSLPAVEKKDLAYLEGDCARLLFAVSPSGGVGGPAGPSFEESLARALAAGEYGRVISEYEAMVLAPGKQPTFVACYSYGIALMKSGRAQEARRIFNNLLTRIREQNQGQLEFKLLALLGDLDFGLGDYPAARSRYEEIERLYGALAARTDRARQQLTALGAASLYREEIAAYAALQLNYLGYDPQRDGFTVVQQVRAFQQRYPFSVVGAAVDELSRKATEDAEKWFAELLARVDQLSADQKNQEALLLIEQILRDILPLDKQAVLQRKKEALAVPATYEPTGSAPVEEEILQTPGVAGSAGPARPDQTAEPAGTADGHVPVTALKQTWEQGMANMQAKEYDKAIEIFSGLLNTSYGSRAGLQIEEASRLAARDDRKRAAELFVRANSTTDPESRKELLISSRGLLEDILLKYPQAGLEEKVRRNLSRIDQELATIEQTSAPVPANGEIQVQGIHDEPVNTKGEGQF